MANYQSYLEGQFNGTMPWIAQASAAESSTLFGRINQLAGMNELPDDKEQVANDEYATLRTLHAADEKMLFIAQSSSVVVGIGLIAVGFAVGGEPQEPASLATIGLLIGGFAATVAPLSERYSHFVKRGLAHAVIGLSTLAERANPQSGRQAQ